MRNVLTCRQVPERRRMPRVVAILVVVAGALSSMMGQCAEQNAPPERPVREIFVPFEDLEVLLQGSAERVFLTRAQYEELAKRAEKAPHDRPPRDKLLLSAEYSGTISDGRAVVNGVLRAEVLEPGLHALPLDLSGVGIRTAILDGKPAALGRDPSGKPVLFVEGRQVHELRLELIAPLTTSAAQQTLQVELPNPGTARLQLTVPGDVDVRGGAAVVRRAVDEATRTTQLELVAPRGPMSLVLSLNNRLLLQQRSVLARSVVVDEVTQAYERIHATVSLAVLHGAVDRFQFRLPAGFEVTDVGTASLARWEVQSGAAPEDRLLTVLLREPTTEKVVVNLSAVNNRVSAQNWSFPRFEVLDVVGQSAVVGLLVEEHLEVTGLDAQNLVSIDAQQLKVALPESVFRAEPGAPRLRAAAAYFAPQATYGLVASFRKPPVRVDVTTNLILTLDHKQQQIRGGFMLRPRSEKLFSVEISVPEDWQVTDVTGEGGGKLAFERFAGEAGGGSRLVVRLAEGVAPGSQANVYLQATRTPAGWLADWPSQSVVFPVFAIADATQDRGALAVLTLDDLVARPESLERLTPLDDKEKAEFGLENTPAALAYRYDAPPYGATMLVERLTPRLTARTFSFLLLDPQGLSAHYEVIYEVGQARTDRLAFRLPETTPDSLSIRGLDQVVVKETASELSEGERIWTASLAEQRQGRVRLAIDFQQPLRTEELQNFSLPLVRAHQVAYQSALVAVEGSPEYDIQIETEARRVDVGELVDSDRPVGRRLLGVYGIADGLGEVWVQVSRRGEYGLPSTLVQRAELVTLVSPFGKSQTAVRFQIRSKASYLEVTLPENATLWSATVDGTPSAPQRNANRLLLSLPAKTDLAPRDVQVVYEMPVEVISLMGDFQAVPPRLVLRDEGEEPVDVPMADVQWHLVLPEGHRVVRSRGSVFAPIEPPRVSPLAVAGAAVYQAAGGIMPLLLSRASRDMSRRADLGIRRQMVTSEEKTAAPEMAGSLAFAPSTAAPVPAEGEMGGGMMGYGAIPKTENRPEGMMGMGMAPVYPGMPGAAPGAGGMPGMAGAAYGPGQPPGAPPAAEPAERPSVEPPTSEAVAESEAAPSAGISASGGVQIGDEGKLTTAGREGRAVQLWGLEGVRSLIIDLDRTGDRVLFQSLGSDPRLQATLVNASRLNYLAGALALLVGLVGVALTNRPVRRKAAYVIESLLLALLLPLAVGWATDLELSTTFEPAFYAACLLVPYYVLVGGLRWLARRSPRLLRQRSAASAATIALAWFVTAAVSQGQEAASPAWQELLDAIRNLPPVQLPDDAVVIPYDPADPDGIRRASKVLIPYQQYAELWNRAFPGQPLEGAKPPADYALAGASYEATLGGENDLLLTGRLEIDCYVDQSVAIPLALAGGVLTRATVDGQPARLNVVQPAGPPAQQAAAPQQQAPPTDANAAAQPEASEGSLLVLNLSGKGRKTMELAARFRLDRSGGWRIARGRLPSAPATQLNWRVPAAQTEVRLTGVPDRELVETQQDNELLASVLSTDGQFAVQWRPKVAVGQVDERLTAQSWALFDIQEDGLRLTWRFDLEFPGTPRDAFTILVPAEYLLERVTGANVRGWRVQPDAAAQRVEVTLLKAVSGKESLTLHLARYMAVGQSAASELETPVVAIAEAVLHQGQVAIRRSPLLDVRAGAMSGVSRVVASEETLRALEATVDAASPLGIRPFETYRFTATPYRLALSATAYPVRVTAEVQSLLRLGERESVYEARVLLDAQDRPAYRVRLALPKDLRLDAVDFAGTCAWSDTETDGQRVLTVFFPEGQPGQFSLVVRGTFPRTAASNTLALPRLAALDVDRQQGYVVVQADPSYEVTAESPRNCESVLLNRVQDWLNEDQRRMARVALFYRTPDYEAVIRTVARAPRVQVFTITNVRVTTREIQQSVYLEYTIREAGIREVAFLLPAGMESSRITVPLLRQKTLERVDGNPNVFRIRLELQDEVMDQLIVLVEHDQALGKGTRPAPIPVVENSAVDAQYVVLESEGRDEIVVTSARGLTPLDRQQSLWKKLTEILAAQITQAYVVSDRASPPEFAFEARAREAVETAGARIGLAQTILTLDGYGAYRAVQEYRVDNKTEQYLDVAMPAGAQLWTVRVAGEPVKPSALTNQPGQVRIPLLKTAPGDLDYPVELKYGGRLPSPKPFQAVDFPLPRTVNINVELSQVRLFLPETHRWFDFGGSMRRVRDAGELDAGVLSYRTKQIRELTEMLTSGSNEYVRMRSASNLKQLSGLMHGYQVRGQRGSALLQKEAAANTAALAEAEQQLKTDYLSLWDASELGNRDRLLSRFNAQSTVRSKNNAIQLGDNFAAGVPAPQVDAKGKAYFNSEWFRKVEADVAGPTSGEKPMSRVAEATAPEPAKRGRSLVVGKGVAVDEAGRPAEAGGAESAVKDEVRRFVEQQRVQQQAPENDRGEMRQRVERYEEQLERQAGQAPSRRFGDESGLTAPADYDAPAPPAAAETTPAEDFYAQSTTAADTRAAVVQLPATGLASLDIELPRRGREYFFTTPRGTVEIKARAIAGPHVERLGRLLVILAVFGIAAVLWQLFRYLNRVLGRRLKATLLTVLGLASLVTLIFPVAGIVSLVTGVVLFFRRQPRAASASS